MHATLETLETTARRRNLAAHQLNGGRLSTAAGLLSLNTTWGDPFLAAPFTIG